MYQATSGTGMAYFLISLFFKVGTEQKENNVKNNLIQTVCLRKEASKFKLGETVV